MSPPPIIAIPACRTVLAERAQHSVQEKYLSAIQIAANGLPIIIPALGQATDIDALLDAVDGLFLTGSPSNIEPHHYNGRRSKPGTLHDPHRDATTLPLIRRAVARQVPLLAVCRGLQEVNVACGGSLHQQVHELDGKMVHHEDYEAALEVRYGPAHTVELTANGRITAIVGQRDLRVNSLHSQAVDRLGQQLVVEAMAPDGVIEAFRIDNGSAFAIAVQWHPEWLVVDDAPSRALFAAFGKACRQHRPANC